MNSIDEIKKYAAGNSVPIMFDETCRFICDYIKSHNIKNILEIGTAIGYSAIQFALCGEDVQVTTIEIDIDRFIRAKENVHGFNLENRIHLNHGDALTFEPDGTFDLIFIDAAKAQYVNFFNRFKSYLKNDGIIISDNLFFHGIVNDESLTKSYSTKKLVRKIKKYVSFLKYNPEFKTEFFELGDGISVSRKNSLYKKITFEKLNLDNEEKIIQMSALATKIVREHFDPLVGTQQNDYMLEKFQSVDAIKQQLNYGYNYYFVLDENEVLGFTAFYKKEDYLYLSKFYLLKEKRKNGFAKNILMFVINEAKKIGLHSIHLNVNKENDAVQIYEHLGFDIIRSEKNAIGSGFFMDDYVMELRF